MYTEQLTQQLSIAAVVSPQTLNGSTGTSGAVDASKFRRIMAVISIGANAGSITAQFQSSATSGGSYANVSGGPTVTAITAANEQATIELRDDELAAGQRYVKLTITEGNSANAVCSGVVLGGEAELKPAKNQDPAAVVQRNVM
jgi:hypothetical protein